MHFCFHFYLVLDSFLIKYETCVSRNQIKILNPYTLAYFLNRWKLLLRWFDQWFINASTLGGMSFNSRRRWNYAN